MTTIQNAICAYIDAHRDEMLSTLKELVLLEGSCRERENVEKTAAFYVKKLREENPDSIRTIEVAENRAPLIVADFGTARKKAPVLFSGHLDTVFNKGTWGENPFSVENGIIRGPGVSDCKGGMVMALYMLKALNACGYDDRPIRFIIVCEEESDHIGSCCDLKIQEEAKGCAFAFNMEPAFSEYDICITRKEQTTFFCKIHGVGGHAGNEPWVAKSALMEAVHKMEDMVRLEDRKAETSVSPTVMHAGIGTTGIPAEAEFVVDTRVCTPEERARVYAGMDAILKHSYIEGTTAEYYTDVAKMPLWFETPEISKLFDAVNATAAELGQESYRKVLRGGAADSGNIAAVNVPVIDCCGMLATGTHSIKETGSLEVMYRKTKLLACALENLKNF